MPRPAPDKNLGQHYLHSQKVIQSICDNFAQEAQAIIEIGPGPAVLTQALAAHEKPLFVVEMDKRFQPALEELIGPENVIMADALKINLESEILKRDFPKDHVWLVSNLPYYASAPLLIRFLQIEQIQLMTLMFQKEVAEKARPPEGQKNAMSSLMALTQTFFVVDTLCKVPPGAFHPPPQVDSQVLSFTRRESPEIPLKEFLGFEKFLRLLFSQRRKQVQKVLRSAYQPENISKALEGIEALPTARAETFNLNQVQLMYQLLKTP